MRLSEREPPTWLNNPFFLEVIRSFEGDKDVKVNSTYLDYITKASDKYASRIFRVTVNYDSKYAKNIKINWIIKIPSGTKINLMDHKSFETENLIYGKTIPEMQRLLKIGDDTIVFSPSMIYHTVEPNYVIILDDLHQKGYEQIKSSLNLDGTIKVIRKLAKWHATSYFLSTDPANHITEYNSGLFNNKYSEIVCFLQENIQYFAEVIKEWEGFEDVSEKLIRFIDNFQENGVRVYSPNASNDGFNVLNHGDLTYKNMMAQTIDNEIKDVVFLDLQLAVWATPAIDIFYVLYLVASSDVRKRFRTELIDYYYTEFLRSLKQSGYLNCPPTKLDLQVELLKNGFIEVVITSAILPFSLMTSQNQEEETNFRKAAYNNPIYKEIMKELIPKFVMKGLLY